MEAKKLKNEVALVKYISSLKGNITSIKLQRAYEGFYGTKNDNYTDDLDEAERKYVYVKKLLKQTPNFERYLTASLKWRMSFNEILKDKSLGIDYEELTEEVFYLCCHIKRYEKKVAEEMAD